MARRSHAVRRREMVDAALDLAAEQGVHRTTTQAIADRVGIAHATVFRHFPNRSALFQTVLERIARILFAALSPAFEGPGPADVRLRSLLERQLAFIGKRRGIPRLLFSERLHLEDPALKRAVRAILEGYVERVAGLIRQGQEEGVFRDDLEPVEEARMIAAMVQGLVLRWSLYEFEFPLAEQAPALIRMVERALSPSGAASEMSPGGLPRGSE